MQKVMLAFWKTDGINTKDFLHALEAEWAPAVVLADGVKGLILNQADIDSGERWDLGGPRGRMADAVVAIWLTDSTVHMLKQQLAVRDDIELGSLPIPQSVERLAVWLVSEHEPKPYRRDWLDGEPSPGIKLITLMRPAEGLVLADCARYWVNQHTSLALRVHVGLWHYVQNVVAQEAGLETGDVFGLAELHFRSRESLREERYDSEEGRRSVRADIPNFMSAEQSQGGYFTERIVRTPLALE